LNWPDLVAAAPRLDPGVTRLAAGLLVLGFGTKAGLAPMHTWLPDAHSQAPAPVSALMSGVLLSVAFYGLLRYRVIIDAAIGPGYLRTMFVTAALVSLLVAASLMITQRDYKRLLAYSSIEHMGIIALAAGIGGPLASAAMLLHMLGHGLTKLVLFSASGTLLREEGTTRISAVHGVLARRPVLGTCLALGLASLLGFPPFSIFASELGVLRAGITGGPALPTLAALVLLLVVFGALTTHGVSILLGPPPPSETASGVSTIPGTVDAGTANRWFTDAPLVGGLGVVAALGVTLGPLHQLLTAAATIVAGTR
jgi:hydrogenase-4 component F